MQTGLGKKLAAEPSPALAHLGDALSRDEAVDLERLAIDLAAEHELSTGIGQGWKLQPRFQSDRTSLLTTYSTLAAALQTEAQPAPAADRFLKSFYLVDEQLQIIGQRLTWRYYHDLPVLAHGPLAGYPRIYAVAFSLVSNINGDLSAETLSRFLRAYQAENPLTIREIRAFDLTLRIVLVKKVKRFAERITPPQVEFERPSALQLAHEELIADLTSLSTLDWHKLIQTISLVDSVLENDPAGVYASMDFVSQERYRRVVERLAMRTELSELDVARRAIEMAAGPIDQPEQEHVGFYLIDDGLPELEKALGYRAGLKESFVRAARQHPTATYLSAYSAITVLVVTGCLLFAVRNGASFWALALVLLLSLVPASEIASISLKLVLRNLIKPHALPRIDTRFGIPDSALTMIVVPAIFSSLAQVKELLATIETHYLTNQDRNIYFALLGDWKTASQAELPDDESLLRLAQLGLDELNARYNDGPFDRFHLFHRRRLWNASEGDWEGWEKKRGKLHEFNRLLRGATDTSYTICTADPHFLKQVRYVISLDSDTELPRDAARKLVGAILHPLNRPQWAEDMVQLRRGYVILQPLVSSLPAKAAVSQIPRLLSGYLGINPYSDPLGTVSTNVYQDLFGEGNYVGKALYDVDAFEAALRDRIPENSVLSHDLLEGLYARSALVSDVEVFDHSPAHYVLNARRNHRWTRGDWQLLPWLWPRVRDAQGRYRRNTLSLIGRWKILDNLRRSLVRPATVFWLVAAWTLLPGAPASWTALILIIFGAAVFLDSAAEMLTQLRRNRFASFRANGWPLIRLSIAATFASIVYLAHQTYLMIDAVGRTLYRLFVSRKRLLEWVTAAQAQEECALRLRVFVSFMWPASLAALACLAILAINGSAALLPAAPLLVVWFLSPLFAYWMSGRIERESEAVEENMTLSVRLNARATWKLLTDSNDEIFAPHVNAERLIAWTMAAHDLGAVTRLELLDRIESTLAEISRPHTSEHKLVPQQILLGETGNLDAFLRALPHRCRELLLQPICDVRAWEGLSDTLLLMKNEFLNVRAMTPRGQADAILYDLSEEIQNCVVYVQTERRAGLRTTTSCARFVNIMQQRAAVIELLLASFVEQCPAIDVEGVRLWAGEFSRLTRALRSELQSFAPWILVRTAHLDPIIRRNCPGVFALWSHIHTALESLPIIALRPERLGQLRLDVAQLRNELEQLPAADREIALRRCAELTTAIEEALPVVNNVKLRYENLVHRCQAFADAQSPGRFDEEYRLMRVQFQVNSVSG